MNNPIAKPIIPSITPKVPPAGSVSQRPLNGSEPQLVRFAQNPWPYPRTTYKLGRSTTKNLTKNLKSYVTKFTLWKTRQKKARSACCRIIFLQWIMNVINRSQSKSPQAVSSFYHSKATTTCHIKNLVTVPAIKCLTEYFLQWLNSVVSTFITNLFDSSKTPWRIDRTNMMKTQWTKRTREGKWEKWPLAPERIEMHKFQAWWLKYRICKPNSGIDHN